MLREKNELSVSLFRPFCYITPLFDRVEIAEAYDRVRTFELQYKNDSQWKTFARGTKIGDAYSKAFEPVTARQVRLNILDYSDGPTIWEFQLMAPKKGNK